MVFPNDLKSMCKDNYAFTLSNNSVHDFYVHAQMLFKNYLFSSLFSSG